MSEAAPTNCTPSGPAGRWLRQEFRVGRVLLAFAITLALLLAVPGETVTTKYLNDIFIFLDGVHRISWGQVPNIDFHSSLGPLAYYLPAAGYALSGSFGGAMPVSMALVVLFLGAVAAHIIGTRMRPSVGLPLGLFLLAVAAMPVNPGERISDLSFAMFYNRIGWSALGLLFVMYLPPAVPRQMQLFGDVACAAALILLMLYLKISYGLVGLVFLILLLGDGRHRRWSALALSAAALGGLLIHLAWGGTQAHLADLRLASRVSGEAPGLREILVTIMQNLADMVVYSLVALLLLAWSRSIKDFLFLGYCAGTGVLLIEQNFQTWGILTLGAGAAVAAEALSRLSMEKVAQGPSPRMAAGANLLLLAFLLPVMVQGALSLALHTALATEQQGHPVPLPNFGEIRLAELWSEGPYDEFVRYNETLRKGAEILAQMEAPRDRVVVLDFVGPFSAGLGLEPPTGDSTWHHWGRTLDEHHHQPARTLLHDAAVVMDPKRPIEHWTAQGLRRIYGGYLVENFRLVQETEHWRIYVAGPVDGEGGGARSVRRSTTRQSTSAQP